MLLSAAAGASTSTTTNDTEANRTGDFYTNSDDGAQQMRGASPSSRQKNGMYGGIHTAADASAYVKERLDAQVDAAIVEAALPNRPIPGDAAVRSAFWTVLDQTQQRSLFLLACARRQFWPRIRTLVGAPPFCFLKPSDNFVLNASGIAPSRANMSHATENVISSASEVGGGHATDEHGRVYLIIRTDNDTQNAFVARRLRNATTAMLDCKLPRMATRERVQIYKRRATERDLVHRIQFPRVGNAVTLQLVESFRASGYDGPMRFYVRSVVQRDSKSPVCRVMLQTR